MRDAPGDLVSAGFHAFATVLVMGLSFWRLHHHQPLGWGITAALAGVAILSLMRYQMLKSRQRKARLKEPFL